jgi:hypothetical protein
VGLEIEGKTIVATGVLKDSNPGFITALLDDGKQVTLPRVHFDQKLYKQRSIDPNSPFTTKIGINRYFFF